MELCECGCGGVPTVAKRTSKRDGQVRGRRNRFVKGHNRRARNVPACGYVVDEETGCWVWQLTRRGQGYGQIAVRSRATCAHIVFYEREVGPVPDGMELDHTCRNRACVNPAHLEPVTHAVNVQRGALAKLTVEEVLKIRADDRPQKAIGNAYGISQAQVSRIKRGESWRNYLALTA